MTEHAIVQTVKQLDIHLGTHGILCKLHQESLPLLETSLFLHVCMLQRHFVDFCALKGFKFV